MTILKELCHAFKYDTMTELAELLAVSPERLHVWSCYGVPKDKRTLLTIILNQRKEILRKTAVIEELKN